ARFGRTAVGINSGTQDDERMLFDIQKFYNVVVFELPSSPADPPLFPYTPLFRSKNSGTQKITSTVAVSMPPTTPVPMECAHSIRSEEHTSALQAREKLVCRLQLEKKKKERCGE